MTLPPAVIVHGAAQRDAALAPGRPVLLLSAPGAALWAGAGWWQALCGESLAALDCGAAPGRALEALAAGCRLVILHPCPAWPAVAARAAPGRVLAARPEALDLGRPGAPRHLAAWLGTPAAP